ncbi:unnamed protein product [Rhizoctonia solani]|uniref:Uncharacterized protein n=1 Tax=Rhizoctonia solani TaxID=456999 RepID=A0A8H3GKL5_9AGAM|nr:unnamed protein product [Rhizoctonia solani]
MSSKRATMNIGSGNNEHRSPGTPVFLVVEHNGRKVGIGRNSNYQETIASIKKNVHELKKTPDDQVMMLAFLEEVDDHVQITEEIWADLLPRLVKVRVELGNASPSPLASPSIQNELSNGIPARGWARSGDGNVGKEAMRAQEEDTEASLKPQGQTETKHKQQGAAPTKLGHQGVFPGYQPSPLSWEAVFADPRGGNPSGSTSRPDQSSTRPTDDDGSRTVPGQTGWAPAFYSFRGRGRGRQRGLGSRGS